MNALSRLWVLPMPPQRLAALRILIGGWALVYTCARAFAIFSTARFPAWQFHPAGPVALLRNPLPPTILALILVATVFLGVLFVLGRGWRWVGPGFAAALLWVLSYRNSWGMVFHTENLLVLHVGVLGLSRAADAWVLGRPSSAAPQNHPRYGWPIRLMAALTVATYFIAGYAKLRSAGFEWVTGDTLRNFVAYDNLRKAELGDHYSALGTAMVRQAWLFPPMAACSLLIELGAPLALLHRRIAYVWSALAWSFHLGVVLIMWIVFPYPLSGMAYAPFVPVERGLQRLATRFARPKISRSQLR